MAFASIPPFIPPSIFHPLIHHPLVFGLLWGILRMALPPYYCFCCQIIFFANYQLFQTFLFVIIFNIIYFKLGPASSVEESWLLYISVFGTVVRIPPVPEFFCERFFILTNLWHRFFQKCSVISQPRSLEFSEQR